MYNASLKILKIYKELSNEHPHTLEHELECNTASVVTYDWNQSLLELDPSSGAITASCMHISKYCCSSSFLLAYSSPILATVSCSSAVGGSIGGYNFLQSSICESQQYTPTNLSFSSLVPAKTAALQTVDYAQTENSTRANASSRDRGHYLLATPPKNVGIFFK